MSIIKDKIDKFLEKNNLNFLSLTKLMKFSNGALHDMVNNRRPFSEKALKKLLPILEISKQELESWVVADKYQPEVIQKAIEFFKNREDKKIPVFTQNIDKILKEKNMSRTALSKAIKYNQAGVNAMIIGKISISKTVLTKISKFLEIPEEDLQAWVLADKYSLKILELAIKII
jgi:plasmid maintenance system antidote protein VapI